MPPLAEQHTRMQGFTAVLNGVRARVWWLARPSCVVELLLRHQVLQADIPAGYETRKPASNDSDPTMAA